MSSTTLTQELYFTTSTVIDWMDVFTRPLYKHIILESLEYCQANKDLDLYAWVLMTNHLHLIVGVNGGFHYDVLVSRTRKDIQPINYSCGGEIQFSCQCFCCH